MRLPFNRLERALPRRGRPPQDLSERVAAFREVLAANSAALGAIARIQEVLADNLPLTPSEVRRLLSTVTVQTYRMVLHLDRLTGNRYPVVERRFQEIRRRLAARVDVAPVSDPVPLVLPLADAGAGLAGVIGQKSAFLAEAARVLPDHVPPGFAVSAEASAAFDAAAGIPALAAEALAGLDPDDVGALFGAAARLAQKIDASPVPHPVADALRTAAATLAADGVRRLAVRSSALQEGGLEMSFAGQYRSLLNVAPDNVVEAYRSVLASKYSPQALAYRLGRGLDDAEVAMCCCVLPMVPAAAAGVLYSAVHGPDGEHTLVQAVRGLGLAAVDGSAEPDSYIVDRVAGRVVARKLGTQREVLRASATEGTERVRLPRDPEGPVLSDQQAVELARLAQRLEEHLGTPVDVEWAVEPDGRPVILQVRPQPAHAESPTAPRRTPVAGAHVLLAGATRASGGAASGPVHRVGSTLDLLRFPRGGVLVVREADPRWAVLLPRAAALVSELGEVTGHLATVARELALPALVAARDAARQLEEGEPVTVDADAGAVYRGVVEVVPAGPSAPAGPRRPHLDPLADAAPLVVPLTLTGRLASDYAPRRCRTLHDIIRFCHQATVEAMFDLGDRATRGGQPLRRLVSPLPIDCRLLDLGGGLRADAPAAEVTIDDVVCRPMLALWRGLTDPRLRWTAARDVSVRGFLSAVVNYNFDADARVRRMGEPSYAFVTADYLNLNSRIGYHFSTVDARLGEHPEGNGVSFRFVGGSTGVTQRSRRAELIRRLLAAGGFETDRRFDLVNGRLRRRPAAELEQALVRLGLLVGFVNHLDMALDSDATVGTYERAFLEGRYGFRGEEEVPA